MVNYDEYRIDKSKCSACEECIDTCPVEGIIMDDDGKAKIRECIGCEACFDLPCPEGAIYGIVVED